MHALTCLVLSFHAEGQHRASPRVISPEECCALQGIFPNGFEGVSNGYFKLNFLRDLAGNSFTASVPIAVMLAGMAATKLNLGLPEDKQVKSGLKLGSMRWVRDILNGRKTIELRPARASEKVQHHRVGVVFQGWLYGAVIITGCEPMDLAAYLARRDAHGMADGTDEDTAFRFLAHEGIFAWTLKEPMWLKDFRPVPVLKGQVTWAKRDPQVFFREQEGM